jgi:hypothetical protein
VGVLARLCASRRPFRRPDPAKDEADRSAAGTAHVGTPTAPSPQARWRWVATTEICFPWRRCHIAAPHKLNPRRLLDEADRLLQADRIFGAAESVLGSRSPPSRWGWHAVDAGPLSDAPHDRVSRGTEQ